jgi:hypothetical protein
MPLVHARGGVLRVRCGRSEACFDVDDPGELLALGEAADVLLDTFDEARGARPRAGSPSEA